MPTAGNLKCLIRRGWLTTPAVTVVFLGFSTPFLGAMFNSSVIASTGRLWNVALKASSGCSQSELIPRSCRNKWFRLADDGNWLACLAAFGLVSSSGFPAARHKISRHHASLVRLDLSQASLRHSWPHLTNLFRMGVQALESGSAQHIC